MAMKDEQHGSEIDVMDLIEIALRRKRMIVVITVSAIVFTLAFTIGSILLPPEKSYLPNRYTPAALMLINEDSSSMNGISSMLSSSGMGNLASLMGVSVGSKSSYSALAVYLTGTNGFLDAIVDRFGLIERYHIRKAVKTESRQELARRIKAIVDEDSGVFLLSFSDRDPVFARDVVNFGVDYLGARFEEMGLDKNKLQKENLEKNIANSFDEILNLEAASQRLDRQASMGGLSPDGVSVVVAANRIKREIEAQVEVYKQLKIQYELLKVSMASKKPVFQVIERAEAPDKKSSPSRSMICLSISFAAFAFSVALSFFLNALGNLRLVRETGRGEDNH